MPQTGTRTAAHARSMRLVSDTITVMPTSTRSPRRNRQPSRSCSRYGAGSASSWGATGRARCGMAQASSSAETPNDAASTISALAGPTTATRPPASAAPSIDAVRSTVELSPVTRSIGTPAVTARVGVMAAFAASPGPRKAPATATRARKPGNDSSPSSCRNGTAPTTASEPQSQRDRHPARADPVDDRAAEHLEHHQRQHLRDRDEAGLLRAPGRGRGRRRAARSSRPGCP